jgi:hypothetical protein
VGRRLHYSKLSSAREQAAKMTPIITDVSQGYASNPTTPNATPNVSPTKSQPPIPYNMPEVSPVKGTSSIFRTEPEIIQEAVEEAVSGEIDGGSGDVKPPLFNLGIKKKRGRIDESENEDEPEVADRNATKESMQGVIGRSIKPLPRKKPPPLALPSLAPVKSIDSDAGTALQDETHSCFPLSPALSFFGVLPISKTRP